MMAVIAGIGLGSALLAGAPAWAEDVQDEARAGQESAGQSRGFVTDDEFYVLYEASDSSYDCLGLYCEITSMLVGVRKDYPDEIMLEAEMDRETDPLLSTDPDANVVAFILPNGSTKPYFQAQIPLEYMTIGEAYFTDVDRYDPSTDKWTDTGVDAEWYRGSTYWKVWVPWRSLGIVDAQFSMRVRDRNGNADDAPDDVTPVIPIKESVDTVPTPQLPGAPTDLKASVEDRVVELSFLPAADGVAVTDYEVQVSLDGGSWETVDSSASRRSAVVGPDVVNGRDPSGSEFDFLMSLRMSAVDGSVYVCGGSLVTPTKVVTAAHCMYDPDGRPVVSVRVGAEDGGYRPATYVTASDIEVHPGYSPSGDTNDIAVLTLSSPLVGVPLVSLPTASQAAAATQGGDSVTSAGWGRTSSGGSAPTTFRVADLTVVPDSVCSDYYGTYRVGGLTYRGIGTSVDVETMLCAGGATIADLPIDTCQGDSGGPLVSGSGSGALLVGVVSWGIGCAGSTNGVQGRLTPGVYTRLAHYLPWLATQGVGDPPAPQTVTRYVRGLVPGTFTLRIRAIGADGAGEWSSPSNAVTISTNDARTPSKPGFLDVVYRVKGSKATAKVYWAATSYDAAVPDSYRYRLRKAGRSWSSWKTVSYSIPELKGVTFTGLKVGKKHRVQVQAVNPAGTSPSLTIVLRPKK